MIRLLIALFALLSVISPGLAQGQNRIAASLAVEHQSLAPASTAMLAIHMVPQPGWHGYWQNPGGAGYAPKFKWTLPKGVSAGAVRYPVPHKLVAIGVMNHVFEGEHAWLVPITLAADIAPRTILPIMLELEYLACTDKICLPQRTALSTTLTVGNAGGSKADPRFDVWRKALAKPLGSQGTYQNADGIFRIALPLPASVAISEPWFFSTTQYALDDAAPQRFWRDGDRLVIEAKAGEAMQLNALEGIIQTRDGEGFAVSLKAGAVARGGDELGAANISVIMLAIGGAILGGLLLNIMPCVFPIISLKALSLARAGGDERTVRREAWAYAAGVTLMCIIMGGVILILRQFGVALGWAFQLQDIRIVFLLFLLGIVITASLGGWLPLRGFAGGHSLAEKGGTTGAFWTGALAAFVATPCTGPFMAAALGAAIVLPPLAGMAVFAGLGLGMALPFILLAHMPVLRNHLPQPGAWMVTFQRWMAVPMALTVVALGWLIWRQTGWAGFGLALLHGFALYALCLLLARKNTGLSLWFLLAALAFTTLSGGGLLTANKIQQVDLPLAGERFSAARLETLRKAGRPVFLYFTADWCLTCKINEKTAIETDHVRKAFNDKGVVVLVGDWTHGDTAITRFLESKGRNGVPLYLAYRGGKSEPEVLPQLLTADMVAEAFE